MFVNIQDCLICKEEQSNETDQILFRSDISESFWSFFHTFMLQDFSVSLKYDSLFFNKIYSIKTTTFQAYLIVLKNFFNGRFESYASRSTLAWIFPKINMSVHKIPTFFHFHFLFFKLFFWLEFLYAK